MPELRGWWDTSADETFWLEVTDRADLGRNLEAPALNESGKDFWSYSLIRRIRTGDTVFHYQKQEAAIVGVSRAVGSPVAHMTEWGARGATARAAGVRPHVRDGWMTPLEGFNRLRSPLTLDRIRLRQTDWAVGLAALATKKPRALYFPFEAGTKRPTRPIQGYLFKLPAFFVRMFPELSAQSGDQPSSHPRAVGEAGSGSVPYWSAAEDASVAGPSVAEVDPGILERALRSHAVTQNGLAAFLRGRGIEPLSPGSGEPDYDIAWVVRGGLWVAEIKSVTEANEERQLRLGLGQVVRYREQLGGRGSVRGALIPERPPKDKSWVEACASVGVVLAWPGALERLFDQPGNPDAGRRKRDP